MPLGAWGQVEDARVGRTARSQDEKELSPHRAKQERTHNFALKPYGYLQPHSDFRGTRISKLTTTDRKPREVQKHGYNAPSPTRSEDCNT